jgi:hypothetical protein
VNAQVISHKDGMMNSKAVNLISIAVSCVLLGGVLGGITNAVNGAVSPLYYETIMRWSDVDTHTASIAQGIFEGLLFGAFVSVVFTSVVGIVTRGTCPYAYAMKSLLLIALTALGFWVLGGLLAMGLAAISPDFYRNTFIGVPSSVPAMLRYAWVGGSIWGAEIGAVLATIIGAIIFRNQWIEEQQAPDQPVRQSE